jgi:hypothetical protein
MVFHGTTALFLLDGDLPEFVLFRAREPDAQEAVFIPGLHLVGLDVIGDLDAAPEGTGLLLPAIILPLSLSSSARRLPCDVRVF